jgi:hypothetical protein
MKSPWALSAFINNGKRLIVDSMSAIEESATAISIAKPRFSIIHHPRP